MSELAEYEKTGNMPRLMVMRLGNDHTYGADAGAARAAFRWRRTTITPLGMIVEAVSKSRFWTSTAIFVLEDDAQNGADHVDSHRSPAFVDLPVREAPRRGRHHVQHHVDAADHGIPAWAASHDPFRRGALGP